MLRSLALLLVFSFAAPATDWGDVNPAVLQPDEAKKLLTAELRTRTREANER